MLYYSKIAFRYLKGRHKVLFTFSNMLSLFGIIIGVFSLLVISSVMNGFDSDMRDRVIGSKAEIHIATKDYHPLSQYENVISRIEKIPGVRAVAPICDNELMLQKQNKIVATVCNGIDLVKYREIAKVLHNVVVGNPTAQDLEKDGIILGLGMSIDLQATVGEYVTLSSPVGTIPTPFGLMPKSKKLKVVGIISSDLPEFNSLYSFVSIKNGQFFSGYSEAVDRIDVATENVENSWKTAEQIQQTLGVDYEVEDWSVFESNLFNAIKMEKAVMFFVLGLMIVIASFNMIGNFIKLVTEKRSEIGILKALGATDKEISKVFILIGTILGSLGTIIGLALSLIILITQKLYPFISIPVAGFPLIWLPVEIRVSDFILVPILVIIISYVTTLYPAKKTVGIEAIKIIRNQD